jgi:predicted nucleic acid-binding protein
MIAVLDASAAAEIVIGRPRAEALAALVAEAEVVRAPELYANEITNLFWKYHRFGGVAAETCGAAVRSALELPDSLVPAGPMCAEVFDLACRARHPAYDLFYLVLARRESATLLTMDRALRALCRKHGVSSMR